MDIVNDVDMSALEEYVKRHINDDVNSNASTNKNEFIDKENGTQVNVDDEGVKFSNPDDEKDFVESATKFSTENMKPENDNGGYKQELSEDEKKPIPEPDRALAYRKALEKCSGNLQYQDYALNPYENWVMFDNEKEDSVKAQLSAIDDQMNLGYYKLALSCIDFFYNAHPEYESVLDDRKSLCQSELSKQQGTIKGDEECNKLFQEWGNAIYLDGYNQEQHNHYVSEFKEISKLGLSDKEYEYYDAYCNKSVEKLGITSEQDVPDIDDSIDIYELYSSDSQENPDKTYTKAEWESYLDSLEKVSLEHKLTGYKIGDTIYIFQRIHTHTPNAVGFVKIAYQYYKPQNIPLTETDKLYLFFIGEDGKVEGNPYTFVDDTYFGMWKLQMKKATDVKGNCIGYYLPRQGQEEKPYKIVPVKRARYEGYIDIPNFIPDDQIYVAIPMTVEMERVQKPWKVVGEDGRVYKQFGDKMGIDTWMGTLLSTAETASDGKTYYRDSTIGFCNCKFCFDLNRDIDNVNRVMTIHVVQDNGYNETSGQYQNFYNEDRDMGKQNRAEEYAYRSSEPLYSKITVGGKTVDYLKLTPTWYAGLKTLTGWDKLKYFIRNFNQGIADNFDINNITSIAVLEGLPVINGIAVSLNDITEDMLETMPAEFRTRIAHNDLYYIVGWKEWVLPNNRFNIASMEFSREVEYINVVGNWTYEKVFRYYSNLSSLKVGESSLTRSDVEGNTPVFQRAKDISSFKSRWERVTNGYHLNIMKGSRDAKEYAWKMVEDYRNRKDIGGVRKFFGLLGRHLWHAVTWVTDLNVSVLGGVKNIVTGADAVTDRDLNVRSGVES